MVRLSMISARSEIVCGSGAEQARRGHVVVAGPGARLPEQLLDAGAELQDLGQRLGIELQHLLAPDGERFQEVERLLETKLHRGRLLAYRGVRQELLQDADRGTDLTPLA